MTLYELLFVLHVFAAIIWVGAATNYFALELWTDISGDLERETSHNEDAEYLAPRLFIPTSMATLIFGVLAAIEGNWSFDSLWIIIGLAGFGVSFGIGIGYFEPETKKLAADIEREGPRGADVRRRMNNLKMVGRIELTVLFIVVASMVLKPTGDDGALLAGMAVILAGVAVWAFAWRGRMSKQISAP